MRRQAFRSSSTGISSTGISASYKIPTTSVRGCLPMSSFDKSQARNKAKRKTKATAKKNKMTMMTKQTTATRSERTLIHFSGGRMKREHFVNAADGALDSLPEEFRSRVKNVAILVEVFPPNQLPPQPGQQRRLLLGIFHGVPATRKSVFDVSMGPAHIVLYQKNIEAAWSNKKNEGQ